MAQLERLKNLSASHCVLLAAHYATSSNITALRALTALREADLPLELILSILLTYLPEQLHPSSYIEYLGDLATDSRNPGDNPATALDISSVEGISNSRAKKRRQALELVSVIHPTYSAETELDVFSHFLIHRAHRIDSEVGLLDTTPELVAPFLESSEYLRTWFISTVLPLLRLSYEYYPQSASCSLDEFARLKGRRAVDYQLSHCHNASGERVNDLPRDIKGVVAPWLCGASDRKRRRISNDAESSTVAQGQTEQPGDWDHLFRWLLDSSRNHLDLINAAFKEWDGPDQMDLGGFEDGRDYVEEEEQRKLEMKYAQTALACIYINAKSDKDSFRIVDALFKRICGLLNFDSSPAFEENKSAVQDLEVPLKWSTSMLKEENLLDLGNEMTKPRNASLHVLEMLLFSAARLSSLEHPMSIRDVASILLRKDQQEQLLLLQKILNTLGNGSQKEDQWSTTRRKLVWLWDWGTGHQSETRPGQGIFGMIERKTLEFEILKTLIQGGHYSLAIETYLSSRFAYKLLSPSDVEQVVLTCAMNFYDNASNGNRSRGNMKRASEIIAAFAPHFPSSSRFQRIQALLAATHAMSFYSLTLQHGVPFQPVNIRVSTNPLSLVKLLLSQNKTSYTKLDDLISIGQNLVISMPSTIMDEATSTTALDATELTRRKAAAERKITGMTIDQALEEDDFETAYSYVVNRLSPNTPSPTPQASTSSIPFFSSSTSTPTETDDAEDVAWKTALRAGRYTSSPSSSRNWGLASNTTSRPDLRRLEQRMDLLSQALLLAPASHLEEVLRVWQMCEADMNELLARESAAEQRFNDAADRKLPGAFDMDSVAVQPQRRELGRGAVEESPMGLFDVARGAAAAFSKTAFPLRGGTTSTSQSRGSGEYTRASHDSTGSGRVSMDLADSTGSLGEERVRKRDMVASAATGALASGSGALVSGLGWVLGAKPVQERGGQERERERDGWD